MKPVYLVAGVPGVGKSWLLNKLAKLKPNLMYIRHDDYIGNKEDYINAITYAANNGLQVITETPFSESQIRQPLQDEGLTVKSVFVVEPENVLVPRYEEDRQQKIPKGHLTRQKTYEDRAKATGAFCGTSKQVFEHLKETL